MLPPVPLILVPSLSVTLPPPPGFSPAAAILQKVGRPNLQLQMVREEKECCSGPMLSNWEAWRGLRQF